MFFFLIIYCIYLVSDYYSFYYLLSSLFQFQALSLYKAQISFHIKVVKFRLKLMETKVIKCKTLQNLHKTHINIISCVIMSNRKASKLAKLCEWRDGHEAGTESIDFSILYKLFCHVRDCDVWS